MLKLKYKFSLCIFFHIKRVNKKEISLNHFIGTLCRQLKDTFFYRSHDYALYNVVDWIKRLEDLKEFDDTWDKVRYLNKILHEIYDWSDTRTIDDPEKLICYVY